MHLWADSDETVRVYYFKAAPGAQVLPGPHAYGDGVYRSKDLPPPAVGEVPGSWRKTRPLKRPPGLDGQKYCGRPEWLRDGAPLGLPPKEQDAQGIPLCCVPQAGGVVGLWLGRSSDHILIPGEGGLLVGGTAGGAAVAPELGTGGLLVGGTAGGAAVAPELGTGGLLVGGTAGASGETYRGTGGLLVGGTARVGPAIYRGTGGLLVGGAALVGPATYRGTGGLLVGGTAGGAFAGGERGTGGLLVGGATSGASGPAEQGSGGLLVGGEAPVSAASLELHDLAITIQE